MPSTDERYAVPGPLDIIGANGVGPVGDLTAPVGAVSESLSQAICNALKCDRKRAAEYGARFTWDNAVDQFLAALEHARGRALQAA